MTTALPGVVSLFRDPFIRCLSATKKPRPQYELQLLVVGSCSIHNRDDGFDLSANAGGVSEFAIATIQHVACSWYLCHFRSAYSLKTLYFVDQAGNFMVKASSLICLVLSLWLHCPYSRLSGYAPGCGPFSGMVPARGYVRTHQGPDESTGDPTQSDLFLVTALCWPCFLICKLPT